MSENVSVKYIAKELGYSVSHVRGMIREGLFKGAIKVKGVWQIPIESVQRLNKAKTVIEGMSLLEAARRTGVPKDFIRDILKNNKIKGKISTGYCSDNYRYIIPESEIETIEALYREKASTSVNEDNPHFWRLLCITILLWSLILYYIYMF